MLSQLNRLMTYVKNHNFSSESISKKYLLNNICIKLKNGTQYQFYHVEFLEKTMFKHFK